MQASVSEACKCAKTFLGARFDAACQINPFQAADITITGLDVVYTILCTLVPAGTEKST